MKNFETVRRIVRELLDQNEGEPDTWPLPDKLRLLAAVYDIEDLETGQDDSGVQEDLRIAAKIVEIFSQDNDDIWVPGRNNETAAQRHAWIDGYKAGLVGDSKKRPSIDFDRIWNIRSFLPLRAISEDSRAWFISEVNNSITP